jgi:hypothetical protein
MAAMPIASQSRIKKKPERMNFVKSATKLTTSAVGSNEVFRLHYISIV